MEYGLCWADGASDGAGQRRGRAETRQDSPCCLGYTHPVSHPRLSQHTHQSRHGLSTTLQTTTPSTLCAPSYGCAALCTTPRCMPGLVVFPQPTSAGPAGTPPPPRAPRAGAGSCAARRAHAHCRPQPAPGRQGGSGAPRASGPSAASAGPGRPQVGAEGTGREGKGREGTGRGRRSGAGSRAGPARC